MFKHGPRVHDDRDRESFNLLSEILFVQARHRVPDPQAIGQFQSLERDSVCSSAIRVWVIPIRQLVSIS